MTMGCAILPSLLQLKEYSEAEQQRHEETVEKLLKQTEEREVVRISNVNLTGRNKGPPPPPNKFKLGKHFNTFCGEVGEGDNRTSSTAQQRLLLRAAFQMLAEKESEKCRSGQKILLEGTLKKASKRKMGIGSTSQSAGAWKSKYVQVMGGALVYADLHNNGRLGKARKLRLYRQKYSCSPLPDVQRGGQQLLDVKTAALGEVRSSNLNGTPTAGRQRFDQSKLLGLHCFELVDSGGRRRIWCTDNLQECLKWVDAITRAMIDAPLRRWPQSPSREQKFRSKSIEFTEDATATFLNVDTTCPYILDKYKYTSIRNGLKSASTMSNYLDELNRLGSGPQDCLIVPVTWVREEFEYILAPCRNRGDDIQIWKDMERDSICINGQVTTGENGLQHIVGELMRALLDKNSIMPVQISEAQCLEAAWEILYKCCRTTSAGDTYLVLDNLCHNSDLVVLVPADNEAYPLAFTITAVVPCEKESPFGGGGTCVEERRVVTGSTPPPSEPLSSLADDVSRGSKSFHKNENNGSSSSSTANNYCHQGGSDEATPSPQPSPKSNSVKTLLHWHLLSSKRNRLKSLNDSAELTKKDEQLRPLKCDSTTPKPLKHRRGSGSRKFHHRRFSSDSSVTVPLENMSSSPTTSIDVHEQQPPLSWSEQNQEGVSSSAGEHRSPPTSIRGADGDTSLSSSHRNGGARIIVSCVAHTSYKLSSSNPTDMESSIHAHLSGVLKQEFTIWPQPLGSGAEKIHTNGSQCYVSLLSKQQQ